MSNTEGPFDWDDENDPVFISDEDFEPSAEPTALEEFRRMMMQDRIIQDFINDAWQFGGIETIADVINHIERKAGWRVEIISDAAVLDNYQFYKYDTFNADNWELYVNSDEFSDLVLDVAYESEMAMRKFVKRTSDTITTKQRFMEVGQKLAKKLVRYFDNRLL